MSKEQEPCLEPAGVVIVANGGKPSELPHHTLEHGLLFALHFRARHGIMTGHQGAFQFQLESSVVETVPGVDNPLSVQRSAQIR